ncbi:MULTISPECIES: acyl-CoA synthetase [Salinibaculum]|uniref:acyl-CoA synthetase n=1 Tax=Salinibaculum TaxID=2732368 RepID=UPI0030D430F9
MALDYETYEAAAESFSWDERWELFDGDTESFNITHECIDRRDDDSTAVRLKFGTGETATYTSGEIGRAANQFANALSERGLEKGDRIAVMLDPCYELYVGMFGIWKFGGVFVQLSPMFGPDAVEYRLDDSDADVVLTTKSAAEETVPEDAAVEVVTVEEDFEDLLAGQPTEYEATTGAKDISAIQYTSGTSGKPSATEMRHETITYVAVRSMFAYGIRAEDRFFCTSSPAWAHGLWIGTTAPLALDTAVGAYSGAFDPETALDALEEFEITNLAAAATAFRKIKTSGLLDEYDLKLKRVATAGEAMDTETQAFFQEQLGVQVADVYGVSEFGGMIMNYNGFDGWEMKLGSIGKPFPGLTVAVIDEEGEECPPDEIGEIAVERGGEWFRTGDAGMVDEDGYYWHKGRKDDVIISSGYRIDPHEVEDSLLAVPEVVEAAVIESPDEERGNIVKAYVKVEGEHSDDLKDDIKTSVKEDLSRHEYPRELEFVQEFPRTEAGGKIQRNKLRELDANEA